MAEIIITEENFETEVLKSEVPVFVDFWAPWCGPCRMIGPIVEELAGEYDKTKVKIVKLNVDENQSIAQKYEVLSIPTFKIFKSGEVADTLVGGVSKEKLQEFIDKQTS